VSGRRQGIERSRSPMRASIGRVDRIQPTVHDSPVCRVPRPRIGVPAPAGVELFSDDLGMVPREVGAVNSNTRSCAKFGRLLACECRVRAGAQSEREYAGAMARPSDFIKQLTSTTIYHPDGTTETRKAPAVWTLAHRGFSGSGRLDVWVFRAKGAALYAGAVLAMEREGRRSGVRTRRCRYPLPGRQGRITCCPAGIPMEVTMAVA